MVTYPELSNFSSYKEAKAESHKAEPQNDLDENDKKKASPAEKAEKETEKRRHLCDPICLLYVKNGNLIPLAIQLTQSPNVTTPTYTRYFH